MPLMIVLDVLAGWGFWSLAHNLGHRWWHEDMRNGKQTVFAHGERQHHRLYDTADEQRQHAEDPHELFISFPARHIAVAALVPVAVYGWLRGWPHALPFAVALYVSLTINHQLHKRFHKEKRMKGVFGRLQHMHEIHHATHNRNFFFVSGLIWDVLFRTAVLRADPRDPEPDQITRAA